MSVRMKHSLKELQKKCGVAIVSGSDYKKICEQVDDNELLSQLDYVFSENGLVARKSNKIIATQSISKHLGEAVLIRIINFCLKYIAELDIPLKRGNFIEYRNGMLNVSPIGRNCTQDERINFYEFDKVHQIRQEFVKALKEEFRDVDIAFSIGGQISIDVFPVGWDKTFCLQFIKEKQIHFFGDRVEVGGNDYEIYSHPSVIPHKVTDPDDTINQLAKIFHI